MKTARVSQTRQRPPFRANDVSCLLSVTDTPDGAVAIFTEKQRAVFRDSNPESWAFNFSTGRALSDRRSDKESESLRRYLRHKEIADPLAADKT